MEGVSRKGTISGLAKLKPYTNSMRFESHYRERCSGDPARVNLSKDSKTSWYNSSTHSRVGKEWCRFGWETWFVGGKSDVPRKAVNR